MGSLSKTNGKSKPPKERKNEREFEFVNYTLTSADKEWLERADCGAEFPLDSVLELVHEGYKFSLSPDVKNASYVASITDREQASEHFNRCLTGRGATPIDAWHALAYRHFVVARDGWHVFASSGNALPSRYG